MWNSKLEEKEILNIEGHGKQQNIFEKLIYRFENIEETKNLGREKLKT